MSIYELATLTSKGQITSPKLIHQALGLDTGSKLAFELHEAVKKAEKNTPGRFESNVNLSVR
ncbi:AbrB/MazE/SpoVT family DNA-binding domain-containing protein [Photorhabdus asymbiotica]